MPLRKNTLLATGAVVAIVGSVSWMIYSQFAPPTSELKVRRAVGAVLAEETARLLGPGGKVLVLNSVTRDECDAFLAGAKRQGLTVTAVVKIDRYDLSSRGPQMGMAGERYLALLRMYRDVNAIVSFVGFPGLEAKQLPAQRPKLIVVSRTRKHARDWFNAQALQLLVVPRFKFPAPITGAPRTPREWFDKYQQLLASSADLPPLEDAAR